MLKTERNLTRIKQIDLYWGWLRKLYHAGLLNKEAYFSAVNELSRQKAKLKA